jgi:hypothetical protein
VERLCHFTNDIQFNHLRIFDLVDTYVSCEIKRAEASRTISVRFSPEPAAQKARHRPINKLRQIRSRATKISELRLVEATATCSSLITIASFSGYLFDKKIQNCSISIPSRTLTKAEQSVHDKTSLIQDLGTCTSANHRNKKVTKSGTRADRLTTGTRIV